MLKTSSLDIIKKNWPDQKDVIEHRCDEFCEMIRNSYNRRSSDEVTIQFLVDFALTILNKQIEEVKNEETKKSMQILYSSIYLVAQNEFFNEKQ